MHSESLEGKIVTVTGAISPQEMHIALPHEHVMSIFGAPAAEVPSYDRDALDAAVLPYLERIKKLGGSAIFDCTAAYFGRSPELLKHISQESGLFIISNTGYYGAANDRYIPEHAFESSAAQLAERWLQEWQRGIGQTGIKPGFIKTGVDDGPLSEIDAKLVRAAARTHLRSGLTIAAHTGNNLQAVSEQLTILAEEGVHPSAWIWVHAHKVASVTPLLETAEKGAWIELDGVSAEVDSIEHHLRFVTAFKQHGLAHRLLLSHDGNSFKWGDKPPKPYEALFTSFIPRLRNAGSGSARPANPVTPTLPAIICVLAVQRYDQKIL
jgi:phosphotriesterase-related protein